MRVAHQKPDRPKFGLQTGSQKDKAWQLNGINLAIFQASLSKSLNSVVYSHVASQYAANNNRIPNCSSPMMP